MRLTYKDKAVMHIAEKIGITLHNIAAVENSCFDVAMFETCGLSIAFNPEDECTKDSADFCCIGKGFIVDCSFFKKLYTIVF